MERVDSIFESFEREVCSMKMIRLVVLGLALALAMLGSAFASEFVYLEGQAVTVVDPAKHTDESSLHAVINMYDPLVYPKVQEGLMELRRCSVLCQVSEALNTNLM